MCFCLFPLKLMICDPQGKDKRNQNRMAFLFLHTVFPYVSIEIPCRIFSLHFQSLLGLLVAYKDGNVTSEFSLAFSLFIQDRLSTGKAHTLCPCWPLSLLPYVMTILHHFLFFFFFTFSFTWLISLCGQHFIMRWPKLISNPQFLLCGRQFVLFQVYQISWCLHRSTSA